MIVKADIAYVLDYVNIYRCETTSVLCASGGMYYVLHFVTLGMILSFCDKNELQLSYKIILVIFYTKHKYDEINS